MTNLFWVTAYCACKICCGPEAQGLTASGIRVKEGRTIAAPRSVPFGTRVYIFNIGWRSVEDRTHIKHDGVFDIYFKSHKQAKKFGKQKLLIYVPR